MRLIFWCLICCVGFATIAVGPCAKIVRSQNELAPRTSKVDELDELIDNLFGANPENSPGVGVIVVRDNKVIAQRQYGMANLEHSVPFNIDHVVRLPYSEGREFIAIAAAFMEKDGLLKLDDLVRDHFPKLPDWSKSVTIHDLIHHRSGFIDEWSVLLLMHGSMANRFDRSQFLKLLYDQPSPEIEPGKGYMYSNSDYGLLRLILEKTAKQKLSEYIKRRIFKPLQMNSSHLVDDFLKVVPNQAAAYAPDNEGYRHQLGKTSPGGDYVIATTANDLARWATAHSDPKSDVATAIIRLKRNSETIPGREGHYAFGHTDSKIDGNRVIRHEGVLECCYLTRLPDVGLSIVTFGNRYYEPEKNPAIVNLLLDRKGESKLKPFPQQLVSVPRKQLARYSGTFLSTNIPSWESQTMARELIRINLTENQLELLRPSWGNFPLVSLGNGKFSHHEESESYPIGMLLSFNNPSHQRPLKLSIKYNDGYPDEEFIRPEKWTPSPELLERLAGKYYSAHLDYTWAMFVDSKGKLVLQAPTMASVEVEPFQENQFLLRLEKFPGMPFHVWLTFHQAKSGEISHLTAWNPRLMRHRFERK